MHKEDQVKNVSCNLCTYLSDWRNWHMFVPYVFFFLLESTSNVRSESVEN